MNSHYLIPAPAVALVSLFAPVMLQLHEAKAEDWPWWRGPDRNGIAKANADQMPPVKFSATESVKWVTPIPGRGHGSAIVVGDYVILQVADEVTEVQSVICHDRKTGEPKWTSEIHRGGFPKINSKASHASSTPACDGERVYVNFVSGGAARTTALNLQDGKQLWQEKISDYIVHQGYSSSPAIYQALVIVSADNKGGGAICGFNKEDGKEVWRVERPKFPNYPSPIILNVGGKDQLFMIGCELVSSFAPLTGEKLWEMEGATTECVTSTVTDGECIFTSGGYPKNHVAAIAADGSKKVVWENISRVYVPSMLIKDGYLYGIMDAGVVVCWNSATGERAWKERLGGTFSSSPVIVGDRFYAANEAGEFFVFKADEKSFELLATSQLGNEVMATPTICDGQIFARVAVRSEGGNARQEFLYCMAAE
ncbi:MAG: PQQ-binding-like beta-propeller repeat protein [Verrucomicrobia bacterium]|nr:PQQ-binding-like beta-propeller repeat protein [Verrucomicrobiota bacterium]